MGQVLSNVIAGNAYTLAVTSYDGVAGQAGGQTWPLSAAPEGSLEALLHAANKAVAFLDFGEASNGAEWLSTPLLARPLGHVLVRSIWTKQFDGLLFIDRMTPITRIPDDAAHTK